MQHLLKTLLAKHKDIRLAILFGSQSTGQVRPDSDIDLAVLGNRPLSAQHKSMLIAEISDTFGRPVDLVDLHTVGEPLLGQIFKGQRIVGSALTMPSSSPGICWTLPIPPLTASHPERKKGRSLDDVAISITETKGGQFFAPEVV